jgi:hypothetical protein
LITSLIDWRHASILTGSERWGIPFVKRKEITKFIDDSEDKGFSLLKNSAQAHVHPGIRERVTIRNDSAKRLKQSGWEGEEEERQRETNK